MSKISKVKWCVEPITKFSEINLKITMHVLFFLNTSQQKRAKHSKNL